MSAAVMPGWFSDSQSGRFAISRMSCWRFTEKSGRSGSSPVIENSPETGVDGLDVLKHGSPGFYDFPEGVPVQLRECAAAENKEVGFAWGGEVADAWECGTGHELVGGVGDVGFD